MEQLEVTFTPADGSPPQVISIRISTPVRGEHSWSTRVEVAGFGKGHSWTTHGSDWAQALELSTMSIPTVLFGMIQEAGGGTLDPPFYERDPPDMSKYPPELLALLSGSPGTDIDANDDVAAGAGEAEKGTDDIASAPVRNPRF